MLIELNVHGLALLDQLNWHLEKGLNIVSGETGAGKSILLLAINLVLGARASGDVVRSGAATARVAARFRVTEDHPSLKIMMDLGFAAPEEQPVTKDILIRREVSQTGRSQAWVNDTPATLGALRMLGDCLVDFCGQHDGQRLLSLSRHTEFLDKLLGTQQDTLVQYRAQFLRCIQLLNAIKADQEERLRLLGSRDYLAFRLEELTALNPSVEDYDRLLEIVRSQRDRAQLRGCLEEILATLDSDDSQPSGGARQRLLRCRHLLLGKGARWSRVSSAVERVDAALTLINDMSFEISKDLAPADDSDDLEQVEARIGRYQDCWRKHNVSNTAELCARRNGLEHQWNLGSEIERRIIDTATVLEGTSREAVRLAGMLTAARQNAAREMERLMDDELAALSMPAARFAVNFDPSEGMEDPLDIEALPEAARKHVAASARLLAHLSSHGAERAVFHLAANRGEKALPLNRCASGGELSRILLGLKHIFAQGCDPVALVFDEVDSGISGRAAHAVGAKLKDLSHKFQLVCISHLAQVAAYADSHVLVTKEGVGERTTSRLRLLTPEERVGEVARLLSGDDLTTESLANARSLIERARERPLGTSDRALNPAEQRTTVGNTRPRKPLGRSKRHDRNAVQA